MSQIGNVIVNDAQATPVAHTFTPQNAQMGTSEPALLLNRASGIYAGFERLTVLVRRSESNKATKVMLKLVKPTLAVTSPNTASGIQPQPTVGYTCLAEVNFTFPDSSTLAERQDMRQLIFNLLTSGQPLIKSAIEDLSPLY